MPRLVQGLRPMGIALLLWGIMTFPSGLILGWNHTYWVLASAVSSLVLFIVGWALIYVLAARRSADCYLALRRTLLEAGADRPSTLETARADCQRLHDAIESRQRQEIGRANERLFGAMGAKPLSPRTRHGRDRGPLPAAVGTIAAARTRFTAGRTPSIRRCSANWRPATRPTRRRFASNTIRPWLPATRNTSASGTKWPTLDERNGEVRRGGGNDPRKVRRVVSRLERGGGRHRTSWTPPEKTPVAVRFGQINVQLSKIRGGIPDDPRLKPPATEYVLPLLLPLPDHPLLLLKSGEAGRGKAIESLQAAMLRLLTSMPAGKIRFTIFDPVGLGENFSAFMHLADFDEQLVSSRIWTDSDHIEQPSATRRSTWKAGSKSISATNSSRSWTTTPSPARWPSRSACW